MGHDLLLILLFTCIAAGLAYMLDYGLGKPGSDEISVTELLSFWTFTLARGRLIDHDLYDDIYFAFPKAHVNKDPVAKALVIKEFKKTVIEKGKEFFTWEKAVGMCIICTGFYIALATSLFAYLTVPLQQMPNYFYFITIPVFSHFILRKL